MTDQKPRPYFNNSIKKNGYLTLRKILLISRKHWPNINSKKTSVQLVDNMRPILVKRPNISIYPANAAIPIAIEGERIYYGNLEKIAYAERGGFYIWFFAAYCEPLDILCVHYEAGRSIGIFDPHKENQFEMYEIKE